MTAVLVIALESTILIVQREASLYAIFFG